MKKKTDLSKLPRHIIKINAKWFKNSKTGEWIAAEKISNHLPISTPKAEAIMAKRWDLNY